MKKATIIIVVAVVVVVVILLLTFFLNIGGFVAYLPSKTVKDLSVYQSEAYIDYEGGEKAVQYLPSYSSFEDAEAVYFHYHSNKIRRFFLKSLPDVFAVDIQYEAELYKQKKYEAFAMYAEGDEASVLKQYQNIIAKHYDKDLDGTLIIRETANEAGGKYVDMFVLTYNDEVCMIRYCFIYRLNERNEYHRMLFLWGEIDNLHSYVTKDN